MGSKARIAKYILPIIIKDRKENQWYIEPFVGGDSSIFGDGVEVIIDLCQHCLYELIKDFYKG